MSYMKCLLAFLLFSFSQTVLAGSNLDGPEIKGGNNPRRCHDRMPVDVYLKCIELQGLLPLRVSDGSYYNRRMIIELRKQPAIGSSNCGQYIEVDAFNTCLNNLIQESKTRVSETPEATPIVTGTTDVST